MHWNWTTQEPLVITGTGIEIITSLKIYLQRLSTKTIQRFKREILFKTYHAGEEGNEYYNPRMYVPYTWIPQWRKTPNKIPRQIREFEAATEPLYQKKFERHNLLPHQHRSLRWLRSQEYFLIVKCDKKLGPTSIERKVYIKNACRDHIYQRDTYLYLPPALAASKMAEIKLKVGAWIKWHAEQLTIMGKKRVPTTNLKANVDPLTMVLWNDQNTFDTVGHETHHLMQWQHYVPHRCMDR